MSDSELTKFYQHVQTAGSLLTPELATRWTRGMLQTLGLNLDKKAKKQLTSQIPEELGGYLNDVWWLFNFRDTTITAIEFQEAAARRCGNTDKVFAQIPLMAVMSGLRMFTDSSTNDAVANGLSPELRDLWEQASALLTT